jgi:hypothetical protein
LIERLLSFFGVAIRLSSLKLLFPQSRFHALEQDFYVVGAHSLLISCKGLSY